MGYTTREIEAMQTEQVKEQQAQHRRKFRFEVLALAQDTLVKTKAGSMPNKSDFSEDDVLAVAKKYMEFISSENSEQPAKAEMRVLLPKE